MNLLLARTGRNYRWLLAVGLAVLVATAVTPIVLAHANLVRSDPAANAILADPPQEIRLWFSETISPEFSSAQLLDINGRPVKLTGIRVDAADPTLMILTLPDLSAGLYSVRWRVLSATDGHFTQGPLVFGVGEGINMESAVVAEPEIALPLPEILLRWLNFSGLMGLVGAVAMAYLVLKPSGHAAAVDTAIAAARRRLLVWAIGCAGLALVGGLGLLVWQISILLETLPENASVWAVSWQLLSQTRWGILWLVRQGLLLGITGLIFWLYRRSPQQTNRQSDRFVLSLLSLLLPAALVIQSLTSHAAALTPNTALAVATDALHLLAAGLWVGGLLALIVGLLPLLWRDKANFVALIKAGWKPFSALAALSVAILLATGLYNTGRQVATVDALITTLYGQMLLSKIGLVLAVGAFGLLNSMLLHPRLAAPLARLLHRPSGWTPLSLKRLPTLVLFEAGLGLLVVLATSFITATPQALGPEFELVPEDIPSMLSQTVDDVLVTFSAEPNRPGQNIFNIRAVSTRRPAPAEIARVMARFTFLDQDMGRTSVDAVEIEPGLYQVGGNYLSLAGPWQIQVVVRRLGFEDSVATFDWAVPPAGEPRPVVLSTYRLEPVLTFAAATIILLISLTVVGLRLARGRSANTLLHIQSRQLRSFQDETDLSTGMEFRTVTAFVTELRPGRLWKRQPTPREYDL